MSTPPPPSGYARCLRALPFLVCFLASRLESTSIYLWGPSWRDVEPFPSASPSSGHFLLLIAVLEGSLAAYHLQSTLGHRLSDVGSLLARDDDGALSLSPCLTEVLFGTPPSDLLSVTGMLW
ncbi:hypothetical protein R3P38DRAFT_1661571 [Favolaschia claudopus]|uniref:Uncharacterized protein n=1 Tax=Favolaschia claudopus TaxID=2862362 RepID=A0AAW0AEL8_9AGAR